jgi:hypothetical protein
MPESGIPAAAINFQKSKTRPRKALARLAGLLAAWRLAVMDQRSLIRGPFTSSNQSYSWMGGVLVLRGYGSPVVKKVWIAATSYRLGKRIVLVAPLQATT